VLRALLLLFCLIQVHSFYIYFYLCLVNVL
jgi:hypothetical protein